MCLIIIITVSTEPSPRFHCRPSIYLYCSNCSISDAFIVYSMATRVLASDSITPPYPRTSFDVICVCFISISADQSTHFLSAAFKDGEHLEQMLRGASRAWLMMTRRNPQERAAENCFSECGRRKRRRVKLAFHDADTDTDILARIFAEMSACRASRRGYLARKSVSWNASLMTRLDRCCVAWTELQQQVDWWCGRRRRFKDTTAWRRQDYIASGILRGSRWVAAAALLGLRSCRRSTRFEMQPLHRRSCARTRRLIGRQGNVAIYRIRLWRTLYSRDGRRPIYYVFSLMDCWQHDTFTRYIR